MNTYNHPLSYFQMPLFFLGEDKKSVGETTLEAFLREWHEGDPARAWYVAENNHSGYELKNTETGEIVAGPFDTMSEVEEAKKDMSADDYEFASLYDVTKWEVRENDNSRMSRYRLIESFDTKEEANQYHLNGLYWNYRDSNRATDAPYSSGNREDVEQEIKTLAAMEAEEAAGE